MYVCTYGLHVSVYSHVCKAAMTIVKCCQTGALGLIFSRDQVTDEFPVELAPAKTLGMFNSSFTAMAWVYGDASATDGKMVDYAIMGTNAFTQDKGFQILVSASISK